MNIALFGSRMKAISGISTLYVPVMGVQSEVLIAFQEYPGYLPANRGEQ